MERRIVKIEDFEPCMWASINEIAILKPDGSKIEATIKPGEGYELATMLRDYNKERDAKRKK